MCRLLTLGPVFGPILCIVIAVQHWFFLFLEFVQPRDTIDLVERSWSREQFAKVRCIHAMLILTAHLQHRNAQRRKRNVTMTIRQSKSYPAHEYPDPLHPSYTFVISRTQAQSLFLMPPPPKTIRAVHSPAHLVLVYPWRSAFQRKRDLT